MHIVITDKPSEMGEEPFDQLLLWQSYHDEAFPKAVSIPALIEQNAPSLRKRYLALIHDLGEAKIAGLKIVDRLELRPGFSYWWMTLFTEKCNFSKSPCITDVISFFAFDDWAKNTPEIKSVKLISANAKLQMCLKNWCSEKNIYFEWQQLPINKDETTIVRKFFNGMPHTAQALVWLLKYIVERWSLRGVGLDEWRKKDANLTFVSYFFNLQTAFAQNGRFGSNYWTELPHMLSEEKVRSKWLHLYTKDTIAPSARCAAKLLREFNINHKSKQSHVFLESFLSVKIVINAIRDYLWIKGVIRQIMASFSTQKNNDNLLVQKHVWPFFKSDWRRSFFGIDAICNLLFFNLFETAFSCLPVQARGVYLQENQGWEFGMVHAWGANNHGQLIGFPHTVVRFWDLRYFHDPRSYHKQRLTLPVPKTVAVGGDAIKSAFLEGACPEECLVEVEALRYLQSKDSSKSQGNAHSISMKRRRILVIGGYVPANTFVQMSLLNENSNNLSNYELVIKPHPACPITQEDYPKLKFSLSNEPLSDLVLKFDVAYTSSQTSAALDAYGAGLKLISVLDPGTLNLSPLRGIEGVRFVSSGMDLWQALREAYSIDNENPKRVRHFNSDPSLPRWRALLTNSHEN